MNVNYSDLWSSDYAVFSEFERENESTIDEKSDQELYVPQTIKKKKITNNNSFLTSDNKNFLTFDNKNFKTK